ncbi:MAG: MBL fold metallo-hydrolase [bacterium]
MIHTQPFPNLTLFDLEQGMAGFRRFISAWLYRDDQLTFLVDPGPKHSVEALLATLKKLDVTRIDYILLTHIHIDHAGGTGRLLEVYPDATVICHPKGIEHMIDPEKLLQGSLKVLGEIAEGYGEILPIPGDRIRFQTEIETGAQPIRVTETPGHAVHHLSYTFGEFLFAGEVAGVSYTSGEKTYARPATPPRFNLEISLASLDKAIALAPGIICFGHFGYRRDAMAAMHSARDQLILWTETVRQELAKGDDNLETRVISALKTRDTAFANLAHLEPDIRIREDYFVGNSIRGIREYIDHQAVVNQHSMSLT